MNRGNALTPAAGYADCAVVIVTYNSGHCIAGLLESLPAAAPGLTLRAVVVDNGSSDDTVRVVRNHPGVTLVEPGKNLGYAGGINEGRRAAGGYSALLVLNPDVVLEKGSVTRMHAALSDPAVGVVVPALIDAEGRRFRSLRREPTLSRAIGEGLLGDRMGRRPGWLSEMVREDEAYQTSHSVDWATGAAFLIAAACDRRVGDWDERFFLYSEETDYAARARARGFRVEFLPAARAYHSGSGSGQSSALAALMAVNRIRYMEKRRGRARAFRAAVILGELARSRDPVHRVALRYLLHRSSWPALSDGMRAGASTGGSPGE
jgi:GT2 family glycosyltransferase